MPVLVHRDGQLVAVAGTMGGASQPQINAVNLIRAFDLGLPPDEAVAAPRWTIWQDEPPTATVEGMVPQAAAQRLQEAGFRVDNLEDVDETVGHAHMIVRRPDGLFQVGSDPRADGGALAT
jgi:gamma-glutamyltranspeptidase/glutathione hydrolase